MGVLALGERSRQRLLRRRQCARRGRIRTLVGVSSPPGGVRSREDSSRGRALVRRASRVDRPQVDAEWVVRGPLCVRPRPTLEPALCRHPRGSSHPQGQGSHAGCRTWSARCCVDERPVRAGHPSTRSRPSASATVVAEVCGGSATPLVEPFVERSAFCRGFVGAKQERRRCRRGEVEDRGEIIKLWSTGPTPRAPRRRPACRAYSARHSHQCRR